MTNDALELLQQLPGSQQDGSHPRPTLLRQAWVGLDRQVGFAHDDQLVGLDEHWERTSAPFQQQIQLPFPPESEASGVGAKDHHSCVWYRIVLNPEDLVQAGHEDGRRLLLHFGAVDHEAMVFVDGQLAGSHTGGQAPFSVDVTAFLDDGDEHVVVVRAFEDPLDTRVPRGKQDWQVEPHVIWYHRTTGIWRTVWLESVPPLHVTRLVWRSDVAAGTVRALVELDRRPSQPITLDLAVGLEGRILAASSTLVDDRCVELTLPLSGQANGVNYEQILWYPGHPVLLDTAAVLHGPAGDDRVAGYLGHRDVAIHGRELLLNFRPVVLRSVLEQGYWPQSHLTPPSLEALRQEVELILSLGFNSARIHQKVEDPRFIFWADKLGLTLWGETAAAYTFDSRAVQLLSAEWVEVVRANEGHPSIITWVPFNESWGVTHLAHDPAQQAYTRALTDLTRALDPTRPVVSNDGWEHTNSDLLTIHDYEWQGEVLGRRYTADGLAEMSRGMGPAGRALVLGEAQRDGVPVLLTEFGGVEFVTTPSADHTWGYSSARDAQDFEDRIRVIMDAVKSSPVLGGYCWTQLTDTLQEANGLCDEHRVPKLPVEILKELMGP